METVRGEEWEEELQEWRGWGRIVGSFFHALSVNSLSNRTSVRCLCESISSVLAAQDVCYQLLSVKGSSCTESCAMFTWAGGRFWASCGIAEAIYAPYAVPGGGAVCVCVCVCGV